MNYMKGVIVLIRHNMPIQSVVFGPDFDPSKARFDLQTAFNNKPEKAMWTSTFNPDVRKIAWISWNLREDAGMLKSCLYRLIPKKSLKVYEIDTVADWLSRRLPKIESPSMLKEFFFGPAFNEGYIDFETLKKRGYDGVHITSNAASLGHNFDIDHKIMLALSCYDVESTVWFNTTWIDKVELVTDDLDSLLK